MAPKDYLAIAFGCAVLYVLVRVFDAPVKWLLRVLGGGVLGLGALWVWNTLFTPHGWGIGLNPVTGATVGLLGVPGFLLLVAVRVLIL